MKALSYRWIGWLVQDRGATCVFLEDALGLEKAWADEAKEITMFRLPSRQEIEVYGPAN